MSSRGLYAGGDREREIAKAYRQVADGLLLRWPVTAGIFISIADSFWARAVEHDAQAQWDSLEWSWALVQGPMFDSERKYMNGVFGMSPFVINL
jgi:hypothetical protein